MPCLPGRRRGHRHRRVRHRRRHRLGRESGRRPLRRCVPPPGETPPGAHRRYGGARLHPPTTSSCRVCGKFTLLRLLNGFERPLSGSVLHDGKDLAALDRSAVRRQCGVVLLQNAHPPTGSVLHWVRGAVAFIQEVWEAAARTCSPRPAADRTSRCAVSCADRRRPGLGRAVPGAAGAAGGTVQCARRDPALCQERSAAAPLRCGR
ncbi:hypothetical protein GUY61_11420 [Streptomyces sp. GC420]|nr:hypothetical protein [Streptomyces sp. GC420]